MTLEETMIFLSRLKRASLQHIHKTFIRKRWQEFVEASKDPRTIQRIKLEKYISENQNTAFGKRYGFSSIKNCNDYKKSVPICDYDKVAPWVERLVNGESKVLTMEDVKIFEKTSGSTAVNKYIPYTDSLLKEFSSASAHWMYDVYSNCKNLIGTNSYWSISQASGNREKTKSGIKIGFEDDSEYFTPLEKWAFKQLSVVPTNVARETTHEEWELKTLVYLAEAGELGVLSVWSPTFAIGLIESLDRRIAQVLPLLSKKRAAALELSCRNGKVDTFILWPRLRLISTWADGPSASFIPKLRSFFPHVLIQPKGLMATEGVVSIPLWGYSGCATAVLSHYLEFLPYGENEKTVGVHELEKGELYSPILTTGGGFYRYHLKDIIKCTGHFNALPLICFEQKLDRVSDIVGEKLNAHFVFQVFNKINEQMNLSHKFALLVPLYDEVAYRLYIECGNEVDLDDLARQLDEGLSHSHHYGYARRLGQLKPLTAKRIRNGHFLYEEHLVSLGIKRGNIKLTFLDSRPGWEKVFLSHEVFPS
jgi:hypothetical protein